MTAADTDESAGAYGREVIRIELDAVAALTERIDAAFEEACRLILDCRRHRLLKSS